VADVQDVSVVCDAGAGRRAAFWALVRHFEHVDVLLGTHAGPRNLLALSTFVQRQRAAAAELTPKLGHVIFNAAAAAHRSDSPPSLLVCAKDHTQGRF